ncbi:MAG: macro domain-containing protein [Elusimicrobia bacterium]|nr:macro domain-containing protein [Elusimicrobiota bacterium]
MSVIIKKGDITKENVDAIVNAANSYLCGGGGVDGAIHRSAGPELDKKCAELISTIKYLSPGSCVITPAYNIKNVKHIIHTVGPVWHGGNNGEPKTLMECYENCFKLAVDNHIKTIAFPSVSTGAYGYPVEKASEIAISASIKNSGFFDTIILVAYSDYDLKVYEENFRRYEDR